MPWRLAVLSGALAGLLAGTGGSLPVQSADGCQGLPGISILGGRYCTHGDDRQLLDPRFRVCVMGAGPLCPKPPSPPPPVVGCGAGSNRVQVLYLRESSQADRYDESLDLIRTAASGADGIVNDSARRESHTAHVRYVTTSDCTVVVGNVVTDRPQNSFEDAIWAAQDAGYTRQDYVYLIFSDNTVGCGVATIQNDSQPDPLRNLNNNRGQYANVSRSCLSGPTVAHELAHTMGAVQVDAPHATQGHHCNDGADRLCYDDGTAGSTQHQVCDLPELLDCGRDDYFAFQPAGSYLGSHWNLVRSRWLDVT